MHKKTPSSETQTVRVRLLDLAVGALVFGLIFPLSGVWRATGMP